MSVEWQPIESAPKNRPIKLRLYGDIVTTCIWDSFAEGWKIIGPLFYSRNLLYIYRGAEEWAEIYE